MEVVNKSDFSDGTAPVVAANYIGNRILPEPDVYITTSGGTRIPAHTSILVYNST